MKNRSTGFCLSSWLSRSTLCTALLSRELGQVLSSTGPGLHSCELHIHPSVHKAHGFPHVLISHVCAWGDIVPGPSSSSSKRQNNKGTHGIHGQVRIKISVEALHRWLWKMFFWWTLFRGKMWKFAFSRAESKRKYHYNFCADENGFTVICKCGIINSADESGVTIWSIWQIMGLLDLSWIVVLASSQC